MNAAFQCIILVTCTTACLNTRIKSCLCINTIRGVHPTQIADVKVYDPRPYCRKQEVIITLKDQRLVCLDPTQQLTQLIVQRRLNTAKVNAIPPKRATAPTAASTTASTTTSTMTSTTASATVAPTSS